MAADPNTIVKEAVDLAISERGEIGIPVAAYLDGKLVVDAWGGLRMKPLGDGRMATRSLRYSPSPKLLRPLRYIFKPSVAWWTTPCPLPTIGPSSARTGKTR
jgi:hypothetical protein